MKTLPIVCLLMKTQFLVCVLLCVGPTKVAAGVVSDIPTSLQVILDSANSHVFFTKIDPDHAWTPTLKQAQESLLVIQAFLEKSTEESKVTAVLGATSPERRIWGLPLKSKKFSRISADIEFNSGVMHGMEKKS